MSLASALMRLKTGPTIRYVILDPLDGTVDNPITVDIHALDQYDNINTGEELGVWVESINSTATHAGLTTIAKGVGSLVISNQLAEVVTLTLKADPARPALDVTSMQNVLFSPGKTTASFGLADWTQLPLQMRIIFKCIRLPNLSTHVFITHHSYTFIHSLPVHPRIAFHTPLPQFHHI